MEDGSDIPDAIHMMYDVSSMYGTPTLIEEEERAEVHTYMYYSRQQSRVSKI
jgi:hypothetical protein